MSEKSCAILPDHKNRKSFPRSSGGIRRFGNDFLILNLSEPACRFPHQSSFSIGDRGRFSVSYMRTSPGRCCWLFLIIRLPWDRARAGSFIFFTKSACHGIVRGLALSSFLQNPPAPRSCVDWRFDRFLKKRLPRDHVWAGALIGFSKSACPEILCRLALSSILQKTPAPGSCSGWHFHLFYKKRLSACCDLAGGSI